MFQKPHPLHAPPSPQDLVSLELCDRPLSTAAVAHIGDALDHNRSLTRLHLNNASINDAAVEVLCGSMVRDADPDLQVRCPGESHPLKFR